MKKILVICLSLLLAGCSLMTGGEEKVVNKFFKALESGDFDTLQTYCTSDNADLGDFSSLIEELQSYQDEDIYGQTFVDEANDFIDTVFDELVESYEITDVSKEDDQYIITVSAKMKNYGDMIDSSKYESIAESYQNEHLSELQEIYQSQGEQVMNEKIYGDIGKEIFDDMSNQIKDVEASDMELQFTIVKDNGKYLISSIQ